MSLDLGIADGEYELELSEVLASQFLRARDPSHRNGAPSRANDEILSIRYGFRPDSIDDTKPAELTRDGTPVKSGAGFQLKSQSTEHDQGIVFEGTIQQPKDLECLLIFNPHTKSFELQKLDLQLRTQSIKKNNRTTAPPLGPSATTSNVKKATDHNNEPKSSTPTPQLPSTSSNTQPQAPVPRKRPIKETSIFQPKPRAKTPLSRPATTSSTSAGTAISKSRNTRDKTPISVSDDEIPLSKLQSPVKKNSSFANTASSLKRSGTASPALPSSSYNSSKKSESSTSTPTVSPTKAVSSTAAAAVSKVANKRPSASPSPVVSPEKKLRAKAAPKATTMKEKSKAEPKVTKEVKKQESKQEDSRNSRNSTPTPRLDSLKPPLPNQVSSKKPPSTISTPTIQQESPSDDEFGSLVDELEEELLSDEDDNSNFITIEDSSKDTTVNESTKYDFGFKNGSGPISFRSLAGMNSKDEDELSSSEEE